MRTREEIKTALNDARTTLVQAIGSANYASAAITSERIDTLTWVLNDENNPVTLVNVEPELCSCTEPDAFWQSASCASCRIKCICPTADDIKFFSEGCKIHTPAVIKARWKKVYAKAEHNYRNGIIDGSSPDTDRERTAEEHF